MIAEVPRLPSYTGKASQLLFHIGHAKTGTSTLQTTLRDSHSQLLRHGVLHVKPATRNGNSRELTPILMDPNAFSDLRLKRWGQTRAEAMEAAQSEWAKVGAQTAKHTPETLVISSESFFRTLDPTCAATLVEKLKNVAEETRVVAYVRSPQSHFLSLTQQRLKDKSRPNAKPAPPNRFRRILGPFSQLFPGKLNLNAFHRANLIDGDIVTDFASKYLPRVPLGDLTRQHKERNVSLSAEAMSVLQDINLGNLTPTQKDVGSIAFIRKIDAVIPAQSRPTLHAHVAEDIINGSAADLFWLRDELDLTFPDIDYSAVKPVSEIKNDFRLSIVSDICVVNQERKNQLIELVRHPEKISKSAS